MSLKESVFVVLYGCSEETEEREEVGIKSGSLSVSLKSENGTWNPHEAHEILHYRQPPGFLPPSVWKAQNCLSPNWWFLNTILGGLERVTYGKSIRQLILKTTKKKQNTTTWQVHLLINSSVGARIMLATGVLTTINPHFRQGEPYWHIFLIWIFNYSVVPHQIIVKLGTRPDRFMQLQRGSGVLRSHEICRS